MSSRIRALAMMAPEFSIGLYGLSTGKQIKYLGQNEREDSYLDLVVYKQIISMVQHFAY